VGVLRSSSAKRRHLRSSGQVRFLSQQRKRSAPGARSTCSSIWLKWCGVAPAHDKLSKTSNHNVNTA